MQYTTLGNTGLLVSRICLSTMTFSDGSDFWNHIGVVDQAGADAMIKASVEAG
jgi:aryl-alcohol dehydrogenase-like predicted oxidoreductase